jgi:hypothetical protein
MRRPLIGLAAMRLGTPDQPALAGFTFGWHQCAASMRRPLIGLAAVRLETPDQPPAIGGQIASASPSFSTRVARSAGAT